MKKLKERGMFVFFCYSFCLIFFRFIQSYLTIKFSFYRYSNPPWHNQFANLFVLQTQTEVLARGQITMTHVNPLFNLIETGFFLYNGNRSQIVKLRFVGYSDSKKKYCKHVLAQQWILKSNNFKSMFNRRYNSYFDAF